MDTPITEYGSSVMNSIDREQSIAFASEIFCELGIIDGIEYVKFPSKGSWEQHTLNFLEHDITKVILKRLETSSFRPHPARYQRPESAAGYEAVFYQRIKR